MVKNDIGLVGTSQQNDLFSKINTYAQALLQRNKSNPSFCKSNQRSANLFRLKTEPSKRFCFSC